MAKRQVGIYLEQSSRGETGGAQTHAAVLTEWLSRRHDVELIVRQRPFDLEELGRKSQTDMSRVRLRSLELGGWSSIERMPVRYDLFIAFSNLRPPVCPARDGVLVVLFPWFAKVEHWPWSAPPGGNPVRNWLRRHYHERRWRKTFAGYRVCVANSIFTQRWIRERWEMDSEVVYPPVLLPAEPPSGGRRNVILSVGRFAPSGNSKRQLDLIRAFADFHASEPALAGWEYWSVGGVSDHPDERAYFEQCVEAARAGPITVVGNLPADELERRFGEAAIFWHGAGYGIDESQYPQYMEQFGIVNVEAMSRGCVPIVTRKGGQPEIVTHGENGFLWSSLDELRDATLRCVASLPLREKLARQAVHDSKRFSRPAFIDAMAKLLPSWV